MNLLKHLNQRGFSKKPMKTLWRQGDILIQESDTLPQNIKRKKGLTLVKSQISGHTHRIAEKRTCRIFISMDESEKQLGTLYIEVFAEKTEIIHDEHTPITLGKGLYRVWRQREFDLSGQYRRVMD